MPIQAPIRPGGSLCRRVCCLTRRERDFTNLLNARGDVLRIRFTTEEGNVIDYMVQYEAFIGGEYRPVVRSDSGHERPHLDVLDWNGKTTEKRWAAEGTTNNQALTDAIGDIEANWERYLDGFLRRRP